MRILDIQPGWCVRADRIICISYSLLSNPSREDVRGLRIRFMEGQVVDNPGWTREQVIDLIKRYKECLGLSTEKDTPYR